MTEATKQRRSLLRAGITICACVIMVTPVTAAAASPASTARARAHFSTSCGVTPVANTTLETSGFVTSNSNPPSKVSITLWKDCNDHYYASATVFKASNGWFFLADASKNGF